MQDKLIDKSCTQFAEVLAAKQSVPGGGGAAAYVGALAAALCSMVGEFTVGKKRYAAYEQDIQRILSQAGRLRGRLLELVDEDAAAFYPLSQAYAIPKDDPSREATIEAATKGACKAPLEMMEQACQVIELLEELEQKGSKMLLSDVGCGALFARAALEAASLAVFVNVRSLGDRTFADAAEHHCSEMLNEYGPRAEAVERMVMARAKGEK